MLAPSSITKSSTDVFGLFFDVEVCRGPDAVVVLVGVTVLAAKYICVACTHTTWRITCLRACTRGGCRAGSCNGAAGSVLDNLLPVWNEC